MGMTLNVAGQSSEGPFEFVASVGDLTVDRLKQGLPAALPATQGEVVGTTITVVSQTGPAGAPGAAGAPGGGGSQNVQPELDGLYATDVASERLLKQVHADFSGLAATIASCSLSAYIRALGGATGTFRLRVGGSDGVADGTLVATLAVTSTSFQMVTASGTVTKPAGTALVKLTGQTSVVGLDAQVKSTVAIFSPG